MNNKRATKRALLTSVMALVMCVVMLVGTTFAWFTDTASTGVNKIVAGNLDVDIIGETSNDHVTTLNFTKANAATDAGATEAVLWEPGCRYLTEGFRIANKGNLALKWKAVVNKGTTGANEGGFDLLDVIDFYLVRSTDVNDMGTALGEFSDSLKAKTNSDVYYIKGVMKTTAGNDYQGLTLDGITITVYATQDNVENDSFGPDYDKYATYYPVLDAAGMKDALVNGGNIKVDANVDPSEVLVVAKDTTIDMNGKTIANTNEVWKDDTNSWSLISARENADLTITGNGTFKAKENDCYAVDVQDSTATVTIENGTFIGNIHAVYVLEGTAYIKGGFYSVQQKFPTPGKENEFVLNCYDANYKNGTAKIIVTGGTFVNFDPSNCKAEGAGTNFVAPGYKVVSEVHGADTWYTVVPNTVSDQTELNNAINGATGAVGVQLPAGTYTLPSLENKDVTIIGTKDTVINMKNEVRKASSVSFEGVTVEFANATYKGFQHTGKLTYKDCTIIGQQFLYATEVEFINCTFEQDSSDAYNVWTYSAGNVLFKDCTFNCAGKSVLIYRESSSVGQTVEFQNCKFKASASVAGKAAIEIDSSLLKDDAIYKVVIDQATEDNVTGFGTGSVSKNSVWNNKSGSRATVIVAGNTVLTAKK